MYSFNKCERSLFITISLAVIVSFAAPFSMAAKGSVEPEIYPRKYTLRYPDAKTIKAMREDVYWELYPKSSFFSRFSGKSDKKNSQTYDILESSSKRYIVLFTDKSRHKKAEKLVKKKYGKLLRPGKMHGLNSVADIDKFADNVRKIVKDVFTRQKFLFLTAEDIDFISNDLGSFVKKYTRDDVSKVLQLRILEALDGYLYDNFQNEPIQNQQNLYLSFDHVVNSLKMILWQVIATEPLTADEKRIFAEQKKWIYDRVDKWTSVSEIEKAHGMYLVDRTFNDVLNGFSMQPMSKELFEDLKKESLTRSGVDYFANWSWIIAEDHYMKRRRQKRKWEFPFGVVTFTTPVTGRPSFSFETKKTKLWTSVWLCDPARSDDLQQFCHTFDIAQRGIIYAPKKIKTCVQLAKWMVKENKGDFYFNEETQSVVSSRGAKMAVLDVHTYMESDRIPTEKLIEAINAKPVTSFSITGYKSLGATYYSKMKSLPFVPMLAIQSKSGDVAVLSLLDIYKSDEPLKKLGFRIQYRFDGWDKLWFDSFITGELKETTK